MTDIEKSINEYIVSLNNLSEEVTVHFDEYYKEIHESDPLRAEKILFLSLICKHIISVAKTLH
jgi:hypothetical protein